MKRICNLSIFNLVIIVWVVILNSSCKTEIDPALLPVLTTTEVIKITEASAQTGGNISSDAGNEIVARGVCWSTSPNPTIEDNKTADAAGTGVFTSKITGLIPSTTYYARAFATNKKGTAYGLQVTFITKSLSLITTAISSVTINSAKSGGTIATDGDSVNVSVRGICWGTESNPTIANSKTSDGKGGGKYASSMTGLTLGTTYFVKAYVTNSGGTFYGNEVSFITQDGAMTLTTTAATSITATSVTIGGSIPNDGGATVTERGLCISKLPIPTITNKIANGSGTGSFANNITSLEANTTYYVRVFATNIVGTVYGNEISFTTQNGIIALTTIAATSTTATSATIGGTITSDGGASITARGICWSKTTNPSTADGKSTNSSTIASFATNITGLSIGATYYVKAYATNSVGTSYGNEVSFTTLDGTIILTTTGMSAITAYTASCGGNITSDGGGVTVIARGICWNTTPNPTTNESKTSNGTNSGLFTSSITGLTFAKTYYVRAYAINSVGTFYGNEVNFETQNGVVSLTTTLPTAIKSISAISGGNITSDGGGVTVTNRGICWSTSTNPTIELITKLSNGIGIGSFSNSTTSLTPNTTYYLRSFATNNAGTFYGNAVSFTTPNTLTDIDGNVYNTVIIGTQIWMAENLKTSKYNNGNLIPNNTENTAWSKGSAAWCYYNNDVALGDKYGKLYNWNVIKSGNLAPLGWHVPSKADWSLLENYLIVNGYNYDGNTYENKYAKSLASTSDWSTNSNSGSIGNNLLKNNTSGFSAFPSAYRSFSGEYASIGLSGWWWCSDDYDVSNGYNIVLLSVYNNVMTTFTDKGMGLSIRFVKN